MFTKGLLWPLILDSIVCLNTYYIYPITKEGNNMLTLTIPGVKNALLYVQENSTNLPFHEGGDKEGMLMLPASLTNEEAYHLRAIEHLEPKLINRLSKNYTVLTLEGQRLLSALSDEAHLEFLRSELYNFGYTNPADCMIFDLLQKRLAAVVPNIKPAIPYADVFGAFFDAALAAQKKATQAIEPLIQDDRPPNFIDESQDTTPEQLPASSDDALNSLSNATELRQKNRSVKKDTLEV